MDENVEKQLGEMLDSVNSINDDFINDYFSTDELSYNLPDKDEEIEDNVDSDIVDDYEENQEQIEDLENEELKDTEELGRENQDDDLVENIEDDIETKESHNDESIDEEIVASEDIDNEIEFPDPEKPFTKWLESNGITNIQMPNN